MIVIKDKLVSKNRFYLGLKYVIALTISLLVMIPLDAGFGDFGNPMVFGLLWLIIGIVFGYNAKKKFKSELFSLFLLSHLTFSILYAILGFLIGKSDFEAIWMGFTLMAMFGLLFGGLSYSLGIWIYSRK